MRSNGSVSLKQASNTLSTTSSASCLLMSLTHNMDFTARSFTHSCQIVKLIHSGYLQCNLMSQMRGKQQMYLFCFHFSLTVSWPPTNNSATECTSTGNFVHELTVNPRKCTIRCVTRGGRLHCWGNFHFIDDRNPQWDLNT